LARGRRGRPELREASLDFNVSHTCGMALIGVAHRPQKGTRIGVDVEHAQRKVNADGLSRKFLSDREREGLSPLAPDARRQGFLRLWTCKEAMSKATGDALAAPFRLLDVSLDRGLALLDGPPPYLPADWTLQPAVVPADFLATVAIWQPVPRQDARIS
jgi:4'-phosphopantetheinyl transferase